MSWLLTNIVEPCQFCAKVHQLIHSTATELKLFRLDDPLLKESFHLCLRQRMRSGKDFLELSTYHCSLLIHR